MNKTTYIPGLSSHEKITCTTEELQSLLSCGRKTAVDIGELAEARVQFGKRVFWNVSKVRNYIDLLSAA